MRGLLCLSAYIFVDKLNSAISALPQIDEMQSDLSVNTYIYLYTCAALLQILYVICVYNTLCCMCLNNLVRE